jgi:Flp pilus assembly protein TadD
VKPKEVKLGEVEGVEEQLERILANGLFRGGGQSEMTGKRLRASHQSSKLLKYLVEQTRRGKNVDEMAVLIDVFGKRADELFRDNSIARAHLQILRKKLAEYYATAGLNDPILIEIPRGTFQPVFIPRERPAETPDVDVERGLFHIDQEAPSNIARAMAHFERALSENRSNADAHAGKAMALCTLTLHDIGASAAEYFAQAEAEARNALEIDDRSFRAHAALGAIYAFRRDWNLADGQFQEALKINAEGTFDHGGYGVYLLGHGKYEDARALAIRNERKYPANPIFLKRAALFLYAMRDFAAAERILKDLFGIDRRLWHAHTLAALLCLQNNRQPEALEHMRASAETDDPDLWPGLHVLCLKRSGHDGEARQRFNALLEVSESGYVEPLQLALGCMAFNESERAIEWLGKGADAGNAHMLWLHLWPFLDELREHPNFKRLIARVGLPPAPR